MVNDKQVLLHMGCFFGEEQINFKNYLINLGIKYWISLPQDSLSINENDLNLLRLLNDYCFYEQELEFFTAYIVSKVYIEIIG